MFRSRERSCSLILICLTFCLKRRSWSRTIEIIQRTSGFLCIDGHWHIRCIGDVYLVYFKVLIALHRGGDVKQLFYESMLASRNSRCLLLLLLWHTGTLPRFSILSPHCMCVCVRLLVGRWQVIGHLVRKFNIFYQILFRTTITHTHTNPHDGSACSSHLSFALCTMHIWSLWVREKFVTRISLIPSCV